LDGEDFDEGSDDEPAAGKKRRFAQLQKRCEEDDGQSDDENDGEVNRLRMNQKRARAKRARLESSPRADGGIKVEKEPEA